MPRAVVVLPSSTYRASDFITAAETLGIDLVVASEQPPPFDMGDRYLQIDCSDPAAAAQQIAELGDDVALDAVVAADDGGVVVAAMTGAALGLRSNPANSAMATRDKYLLRTMLSSAEVPQPQFGLPSNNAEAAAIAGRIGYPVVLKPLDRSASQGVIRVDDESALIPTMVEIRRIVGDDTADVLIEKYVPGPEIAVEGLLADGELMVLAIFDKPDTGDGPAFPETIFVTPSRHPLDLQEEAIRVAQRATEAIGLTHGPVHIELRIEDGIPHIIEMAARSIGGLCSRSLNFGLMGTTLETLILRNAIGLDKPELRREPHASGVLMLPIPRSGRFEGIDGLDDILELPAITGFDISARVGSPLMAPPEGDSYLGFVYARADTAELVEISLRKAMKRAVVDIT